MDYIVLLLLLSLQPCPTLCDPIEGSPPGSSVPGILQARTLEWVAISFSSCIVHGVSKSQTRLSDLHFDLCRWIQVSRGFFLFNGRSTKQVSRFGEESFKFYIYFSPLLTGKKKNV